MSYRYKKALFVFRRDLRLSDNTALLSVASEAESVLPCFIFDPRQINPHPYKSDRALGFMLGSLKELASQIAAKGGELKFYQGEQQEIIEKLLMNLSFDAVYINLDYTPFARERDRQIEAITKKLNRTFHGFHDALLTPPGSIVKSDGEGYQVYTAFWKRALKEEVPKPQNIPTVNWLTLETKQVYETNLAELSAKDPGVASGRNAALEILSSISKFRNYTEERDIPYLNKTTHLAPHNKFGTVSPREVFYKIKEAHGSEHLLLKELYWRDFFTHVAFHFPHVFKGAFNKVYDKIRWNNNDEFFRAWVEGKTGFPIVDAGMRELKETGFMHNRVRMIVASFLVKDLHLHWHLGEKYFAQQLTDYDPAVNNGNWQWAASTGCDAQPYFRIFNPWRQIERFDPECKYIKQWLPELSALSATEIKSLEKGNGLPILGYPAQIVDHSEAKIDAEELFRDVLQK